MKKLKNENGAITILVVVSVLFMVSFLISSYTIIANKVQAQKEMITETKKIYENNSNMEETYNSYFNNENIIPIYNAEQLVRIGSGETYEIDGKYYTFSKDATYIFMNDIQFNAKDIEYLNGKDWIPIGKTDINFDGNGREITVTTIDGQKRKYNRENNYYYQLGKGYIQVEYIEGTGTQYIDTGTKLNQDSKVEIKYASDGKREKRIFGSRTSATSNAFTINCYNIEGYCLDFYSYSDNRLTTRKYDTDIHTYKISNSSMEFDNISQKITKYSDFETPYNAYIFNISGTPSDKTSIAGGKLYYCKIWYKDILIRDFIPCYREVDKVAGLYDVVNNKFYINVGTGEFLFGPEVV